MKIIIAESSTEGFYIFWERKGEIFCLVYEFYDAYGMLLYPILSRSDPLHLRQLLQEHRQTRKDRVKHLLGFAIIDDLGENFAFGDRRIEFMEDISDKELPRADEFFGFFYGCIECIGDKTNLVFFIYELIVRKMTLPISYDISLQSLERYE